MFARRLFLVAAALAAACNHVPSQRVNGSIDGVVYLTAPVGGATVTAYALDPQTGQTIDPQTKMPAQTELGHSAPSGGDGSFHVELGGYTGLVLLSARGANASYVEPATGQTVTWDAAEQLLG